jgi:hypothetical protein
VGVVVALLLSVAAAGSFFSPLLDLDRIEVRGVEGDRRAEVRRSAAVSEGEAMVAIDPAEVRARLEELPFVAHARVHLEWPDGLVVAVSPHRPVAVLAAGDGEATHVLTRAAEVVPIDAVDAAGRRAVRLEVAPTELADRERLALVVLLGSLGQVGERQLGELVALPGDRYRFAGLGDIEGAEVELGEMDALVAKSRALEALLGGAVDLECLARLDVSVPARVTVSRDPVCAAAVGDDR